MVKEQLLIIFKNLIKFQVVLKKTLILVFFQHLIIFLVKFIQKKISNLINLSTLILIFQKDFFSHFLNHLIIIKIVYMNGEFFLIFKLPLLFI